MKKCVIFLCAILLMQQNVYSDEIKLPDVEALGAIIIDANTSRVLWGRNEHTPLANASTTKIMTAIVALENGNLNDIVRVSSNAAATPEVKMYLKTGEEIKLEYLIYALMLQSSNDAAVAIAEHIAGDVKTFCNMMTQRAKELGAKNTVFETPNGLDKGEHHSTAYDMALIAKHALSIKKFVEISNTPAIRAESNVKPYDIVNKNRLLREFEGANGVKTGFTGKAGHCFVGAAKRDNMQLITVVLGSGWGNKGKEQKWIDTKQLLNYGFNNYKYEVLVEKGKKAGSITVDRSKTEEIEVNFKDGCILPINKEEKDKVNIAVEVPTVLRAPVEANQEIGVAKVYLDKDLFAEIPILTKEGAERHDLKTSLERVINNWLELGTNDKVEIILPEF